VLNKIFIGSQLLDRILHYMWKEFMQRKVSIINQLLKLM